jgi:GAF domain-containing protein
LDKDAQHMVAYVLRTGKMEVINDVSDQILQEAARDAEHLETLRSLGFGAYISIPLQARGRNLGVVTFVRSEPGRRYSPREVDLARELVRRAGLAADNASLYQESQAAQTRLQLAAEASNELIASLDFETRMEHLAQLVVPRFADWCAVNLVAEDGSIHLAALAHVNPEMIPVIREWAERHPLALDAPGGTPAVIRSGKAEWVSNVARYVSSEDGIEPGAAQVRKVYQERLGVQSYMIVPLVARGRTFGAITFARGEPSPRYTFQDLLIGEEIARRAGIAMDNAALFQQEQRARHDAEENALRISTLQNITEAVGAVLAPERVAEIVLEQALAALGAGAGSVSLLNPDGKTVKIIRASGYDPEVVEAWRSVPLDTPAPLPEAIRTGEMILLSGRERLLARYPKILERQDSLIGRAWAAIPLISEGRVLGVLGLTFAEERQFNAPDRAFMNALAQQSAQAMERARLYQAEQQARAAVERNVARVAVLQRVTSALAATLTSEQVGQVVLEHGANALGAEGGALARLSDDGQTVEILSAFGYSPEAIDRWKQFPISTRRPLADAIRSGEMLVFESPEALTARYPNLDRLDDRYQTWMHLPLVIEGRTLGGLNLSFLEPHVVTPADRAFATALAQQCAQALERARLYESEQVARRAAEHAAHRSEWLTEASHLLASDLQYETTLQELAKLAVPELADWCQIHIAKGDGTAEQLVLAHRDPEKLAWANDLMEEIRQYFEPRWDAPRGLPNVLRTGKSEIYYDIPDALLVEVAENQVQLDILRGIGYSSVMIIPLNAGGKTLGAITLVSTESRRHFTDDDLAFAELLAGRAAVAIENARLYRETQTLNADLEARVQQRTYELSEAYNDLSREAVERTRAQEALKDSYAQLRALAARLQTIREEERAGIARELHDELGQALTALKMDLVALMGRLPKRSPQLFERAQVMSEQIDATIKTVRRMSSQLRPGMLDDLGLGPSMEWYAQEFQARTGITCTVTVPGEELQLDRTQATALFRIFQETLTNVARHARATTVRAELVREDGGLRLQVADNGRGFDPEEVRGKRSLGLLGMRERAEMLEGTLEIDGDSGAGTTITVRLPLTHASVEPVENS